MRRPATLEFSKFDKRLGHINHHFRSMSESQQLVFFPFQTPSSALSPPLISLSEMDHWKIPLLLLLISWAIACEGKTRNREVYYDSCHIDCGAKNGTKTDYGLVVWDTDDRFVKTGQNFLLVNSKNFNPMSSLRYFPAGLKNCYQIRFGGANWKAIFKAGFLYGNYDGLSKPPSFDLEIDGNLWASVITSMNEDEPVYHEMIYRVKGDTSQVCLVRTNADEVPFISSLEAKLLYYEGMYKLMENGTALHLHSRINYGANKSIERYITAEDEDYNRIWKSVEMSEYLNINSGFISNSSFINENEPPLPVMDFAIQAKNLSDSLYLSVDFSTQTSSVAYFVFYFMDPWLRFPYKTGKVEILVDGVKLGATVIPNGTVMWGEYSVVSLYPVQVKSVANITIAPAEGSALAPLLNAMEVFSVTSVSGCFTKYSISLGSIFLQVYVVLLFLI